MDGFSAAVNVGSAIDLSVKGLAYLAKYYSDVKTAEASLHEFKECLTQELQALKQLKTLYERLKEQEDLTPHSVECLHSLEQLFQEDSNHPESKCFYKELRELVEWLEKQSLKKKRVSVLRHINFLRGRKGSGHGLNTTEGGMGLSQKLKWPMKGKKKIQKIMPRLKWHKGQLMFALQLTQM